MNKFIVLLACATAVVARPGAPLSYSTAVHTSQPIAHAIASPVVSLNHQPALAVHHAPIVHHAPAVAVAHAPVVHAAPVLAKTVAAEPFDPHPQYNYGYSVSDSLTGDQKSAHESRDGDVVQGQYSLVEPDGAVRTVTYTADAINGFNAVVDRSAPTVVHKAFSLCPIQRSSTPLQSTLSTTPSPQSPTPLLPQLMPPTTPSLQLMLATPSLDQLMLPTTPSPQLMLATPSLDQPMPAMDLSTISS